jgi:hypothetical protein
VGQLVVELLGVLPGDPVIAAAHGRGLQRHAARLLHAVIGNEEVPGRDSS